MFVDTSVIVAIFSKEEDAQQWIGKIEAAESLCTSALVVLETAMRLSTKLDEDPLVIEQGLSDFFKETKIQIIPIEEADGELAIRAFRDYGKGRGHPAQLNLADCLSYACAKNRGVPLLYKGADFARTDLA
ncbi:MULTISPECIES: type II toxin-antitoxin system VapC family toxin [unclassified Neorhizobium]|uniref:type II toxin-antitoxin system VapC family toxin n=1 Tax=unclassified Neorhizobium TaxID=2629175 RepID=UPI001FF4811C|nr:MULTISPECIES: type II toxin-antitoxin system VapC family toxin [unclassified Neorhizobium]MCJ9671916.1 type II toxin-antitoxin system VapC family toxin [Neorhizobium sp. SHOUNA12B]MCJ9747261.1 type II toxin-antitoxin system VapC family toxin [Neorhizobium sp. SHOUNA12A]